MRLANVSIAKRREELEASRQHEHPASKSVGDMRFRALLGNDEWAKLPAEVQKRFTKRLTGAQSAVYAGEVLDCHISHTGMFLAKLLRIIGAPLPLSRHVGIPAIVSVTEDEANHGQIWSRQYGRHDTVPQVIHSVKQFAGPTGLEELIGGGLGVALRLSVADGILLFKSDHYFLKIWGHRFPLPRLFSPGALTVGHAPKGETAFDFTLKLEHALFGLLIDQRARFHDVE